MAGIILDGTGTGSMAAVTTRNFLKTEAVTISEEFDAVRNARAYNINTGDIAFTTGGQANGVLYVKYTGTKSLVVNSFIYLLGADTGGAATENTKVEVIKEPTGGTLSSGTAVTPVNRAFASANTLAATVTKGADGTTVTGGTVAVESIFPSTGRQVVAVPVVLSTNNIIALRFTTKGSTTAQTCQFAMAVYETA